MCIDLSEALWVIAKKGVRTNYFIFIVTLVFRPGLGEDALFIYIQAVIFCVP